MNPGPATAGCMGPLLFWLTYLDKVYHGVYTARKFKSGGRSGPRKKEREMGGGERCGGGGKRMAVKRRG